MDPCPDCAKRLSTRFFEMDEAELRLFVIGAMVVDCLRCTANWRIVREGENVAFSDFPGVKCPCGRWTIWGCSLDGGWTFQKCASYLRMTHGPHDARAAICEVCLEEVENCGCGPVGPTLNRQAELPQEDEKA